MLICLSYSHSGPFEWYQGYGSLRHLFNPVQFSIQSTASTMKPHDGSFPPNAPMSPFPPQHECRVLILGCGNSTFSEEMYRDGWTGRMVSVDWSSVVIKQMQDKYNESYYEKLWNERAAKAPKMEFLCADITQKLPFEDESFDLIVCKGSFDAVLCSSSPITSIRRVVAECVRVLAPGHGVFFLVTTGTPDNRTLYLEHQNELDYYWQGVGVHAVPRPSTSVTPGYVHLQSNF